MHLFLGLLLSSLYCFCAFASDLSNCLTLESEGMFLIATQVLPQEGEPETDTNYLHDHYVYTGSAVLGGICYTENGGNSPLTKQTAVAVSPDDRYLFVVSQRDHAVMVVDVEGRCILSKIPFISGFLSDALLSLKDDYIRVIKLSGTTVAIEYVGKNEKTTLFLSLVDRSMSTAIAYSGHFLYILNHESMALSTIDLVSHEIIATLGLSETSSKQEPFPEGSTFTEGEKGGIAGTQKPKGQDNPDYAKEEKKQEVLPPRDFIGKRKRNNFGARREYFTELSWQPSESEVTGYLLFRNGEQIASLPGTVLSFQDRSRSVAKADTYDLRAVNAEGLTSKPVTIIITKGN